MVGVCDYSASIHTQNKKTYCDNNANENYDGMLVVLVTVMINFITFTIASIKNLTQLQFRCMITHGNRQVELHFMVINFSCSKVALTTQDL
jgi:hypothetical protein